MFHSNNHLALLILDKCKGEEKADLTNESYQRSSDTAEHNLALTLSGNNGSRIHTMFTLITLTVFLSCL